MENIGQILKTTRTELRQSFDEIHAQTRIAVEHMQFLEENNFTFLPETYIKSFLKTYANALGLGGDDILHKYNQNKQDEIVRQEKEIRVQVEKVEAAQPLNRVLEWTLAAGAFLVLVFIILVYLQYRSEIYARPIEHNNGYLKKAHFEPGNPALPAMAAPAVVTTKFFQLHMTGLEQLAIRLDVTGVHVNDSNTEAHPSTSTITAVERFDILIDEATGMSLKFDEMEMTNLGAAGGKVRLSIVRGGAQ